MRNSQRKWNVFGTVLIGLTLSVLPTLAFAGEISLYFPADWKEKAAKAKEITETLAKSSGLDLKPRVAGSNAELIDVFNKKESAVVYVGSLVSTILSSRNLSTPLLQGITGKELYAPVLIVPVAGGENGDALVKEAGEAIAYAKSATSGELGAKAASGGKANVAANNHGAAMNAVKAGKAKIAFVKNWWWEDKKGDYPEFKKLEIPGISDTKNPDNVLSISKTVSAEDASKIKQAAMANTTVFGVQSFKEVDNTLFDSTRDLMKKANMDPATYTW